MAKVRKIWTNFSKGELSPFIEGRPDLAAYFEGARRVENFQILRQGGLARRPGTRFIAEVKDSTKDTILLPFEFSADDAAVIEVGHQYMRFYRNRAQLKVSAGGPPVEVTSPYTESQLRDIHLTQSADVLFLFHPNVAQRKLSRVSDTDWILAQIKYTAPPSFEADTDISQPNVTLTPAATTGTDVLFTASAAVFFAADVGRQIIAGAARAVITGYGASAGDTTHPNTKVRADIIDDFPNTDPIPAGQWLLRLSPQSAIDPDKKAPAGAQITLTADKNTFRSADVGKHIIVYGGTIKITQVTSATVVKGEILTELSKATASDPPATAAGTWTLEVVSWSVIFGFPRTGEFFEGRLLQAGTSKQQTTFWGSASDDFDNYAIGALADDPFEYTVASRKINQIRWLADNINLFLGTAGAEFRVTSGRGEEEPLGGDVIPLVRRVTSHGVAAIQPVVIARRTLFLDRSRKKIFAVAFNLEEDGFDALEITGAAEHITGDGIRLGPIAFAQRPDPRLYMVRSDGTLVTLTFFHHERVIGFTRFVTDGFFEAVAVVPQAVGFHDQVWVIVRRTISGVTKRYVEMFETEHESLTGRQWRSLQTDSAVVYSGTPTTTISGLSHLNGKTVDVIADGSYRGTKVVSGGSITLDAAASNVEVGLHYDSVCVTMRPAVEGAVIEGLPRSWDKVWVRLFQTIGGKVNDEQLLFVPSPLDTIDLFTGDVDVTGQGWDTEGRIKITQDQPYPMTILAVFGELSLGAHG